MTYTEAENYINEVPKFTTKNEAGNTIELIRRLGHPERKMKVIHVAGTNGKGSVCAFLSSMLAAGGKKTGLFISPHLVKINERFQINNESVEDDVFLAAFEKVMKVIQEMTQDGFFHPTYFEILFAIGMVIFGEYEVEYLVMETGLGGRLDATNVVEKPIVSVITSVSLDHTEYLGDTVAQIAWEKAGIIKPSVPVVFDARNPESEGVILDMAREKGSLAVGLKEDMYQVLESSEKGITFYLNQPPYESKKIMVPYIAPYQVTNSSLALLAMEQIDPQHTISIETRIEAIKETKWQGRMETVLPGIIVDGAHNEDGVREFVRTLKTVKDRRIVILFSAVVEKNYDHMVKTICETGCLDEVVVTEIKGYRNVPAETLAGVFQKYTDVPVTAVSDIKEAFTEAKKKRGDGLLFCVGSLYLVGEIKRVIGESVND